MKKPNRYKQIIAELFRRRYSPGSKEVAFTTKDFRQVAAELKIELPNNPPDILYTYRHRAELPDSIATLAPSGKQWVIRGTGRGTYRFVALRVSAITPNPMLSVTKIPDSTPGVIARYKLDDEQSLLAMIRYNRLLDIFTGVACYSLQNHLRSSVTGIGQVEIDELYVGVDKRGAHYVLPVQAKVGRDKLGITQIESDIAFCVKKYPLLICRSIGTYLMSDDLIAIYEFEKARGVVTLINERHYRLVPQETMTDDDLKLYRSRSDE